MKPYDMMSECVPMLEALGISTRGMDYWSVFGISCAIGHDSEHRRVKQQMMQEGKGTGEHGHGCPDDLAVIEAMTPDEKRGLFARLQPHVLREAQNAFNASSNPAMRVREIELAK